MRVEEESIAAAGCDAVEDAAGREGRGLDPGFERDGPLERQGGLCRSSRGLPSPERSNPCPAKRNEPERLGQLGDFTFP